MHPRAIANFLEKNRVASAKFVQDKPVRDDWFKTHLFRPAANLCIDERVQDFDDALGLPIGVLEAYRSGGSKSNFASLSYARRCNEGVMRLTPINGNGSGKRMVEMRMVTAHYSQAYPKSHSCAAWNHQTADAVEAMKKHAAELNDAFLGRMVAIVVLIDTDLDAVTLVGTNGNTLSVREEINLGFFTSYGKTVLANHLRRFFSPDWEPLLALEPTFRSAFHAELAERVNANAQYVQNAFDRPPELLDHKGELIFVGRHADWIREHNSVFLIDDTEERGNVLAYYELALRFVARNVVRRAIVENNDDWTVPIVINIPHDDEQDERVTRLYAHQLRLDLERHATEVTDKTVSWMLDGKDAIPPDEIPDRVFRQIHTLKKRLAFITSVSRRADRLFRPLE